MKCHNCGCDTPHNYDPVDSYPHTCCGPECPCVSIEKRAAEKGYRKGAEEALRRVGEYKPEFTTEVRVWMVRKEMGLFIKQEKR